MKAGPPSNIRVAMRWVILFVLPLIAFMATSVQAQDKTWFDDWKELMQTSAFVIHRQNPFASCVTDWVPAPMSVEKLTYAVCWVDGYHDPSSHWLVISVNDTSYPGRRFVVHSLKDDKLYWHHAFVNHHQSESAHVVYLGPAQQASEIEAIAILDLDSWQEITIKPSRKRRITSTGP